MNILKLLVSASILVTYMTSGVWASPGSQDLYDLDSLRDAMGQTQIYALPNFAPDQMEEFVADCNSRLMALPDESGSIAAIVTFKYPIQIATMSSLLGGDQGEIVSVMYVDSSGEYQEEPISEIEDDQNEFDIDIVGQIWVGARVRSTKAGLSAIAGITFVAAVDIGPSELIAESNDGILLISRPVFSEYGQWMLTKNSNQPGAEGLPTIFLLNENYPNPFNPITTISFSLGEAMDYQLKIYNTLGQEVGDYTGRDGPGQVDIVWNASGLASGVYLYRLTVRDKVESKKMLLLK